MTDRLFSMYIMCENIKNFYADVVMAYDQHSSQSEEISFHNPKDHGNHGPHTQLTFFDRESKQNGAIRINVGETSLLG